MMPIWMEYLIFYGFFAFSIAFFILLILFILYRFKWLPKAAIELKRAKDKHRPIRIQFFDSGIARICTDKHFTEDILESSTGDIGILPSKVKANPERQCDKCGYKVTDKEAKFCPACGAELQKPKPVKPEEIEKVNSVITAKYIEESTGVPIWLQYGSTAVLFNGGTLASLQHGYPLDASIIKNYISKAYPQSKIKQAMEKRTLLGMLKSKKIFGTTQKVTTSIALVLVLGIILVLLFALIGG
ncbi:hypothetical protein DRO19_02725 [Candidatus Bathyarchaeota archaeon]|nr:MAG: hypothetical protein DRO19_02725 [Candidatus Bathyarchaeota archaeon]